MGAQWTRGPSPRGERGVDRDGHIGRGSITVTQQATAEVRVLRAGAATLRGRATTPDQGARRRRAAAADGRGRTARLRQDRPPRPVAAVASTWPGAVDHARSRARRRGGAARRADAGTGPIAGCVGRRGSRDGGTRAASCGPALARLAGGGDRARVAGDPGPRRPPAAVEPLGARAGRGRAAPRAAVAAHRHGDTGGSAVAPLPAAGPWGLVPAPPGGPRLLVRGGGRAGAPTGAGRAARGTGPRAGRADRGV